MNYFLITFYVIIILAWVSLLLAYRKDWHDPKVRDNIRGYFIVALIMIIFVGLVERKFRGVQMIPGPITTLNHNR